jgi:hypothetical protein
MIEKVELEQLQRDSILNDADETSVFTQIQ